MLSYGVTRPPRFYVLSRKRTIYVRRQTCSIKEINDLLASTEHDFSMVLIHWGRLTHICVSNQTNIGSDNGLSPGRRQTIVWNNAGLLLNTFETNFGEILIEIHTFSFMKKHLKNVVCELAAILSRPRFNSICMMHYSYFTEQCIACLNHFYPQ